MELFTVAFFGHRYIENSFQLEEVLDECVRNILFEKAYVEFLVGRNGIFDQYAASAVRRAKRDYRNDNSELILVLAYPTAEYLNNEESFEAYYDAIRIANLGSRVHPKAAIQARNREMVDSADLIICFIEKSYGGAYRTVEYARKKNKRIVNVAVDLRKKS